MTQATQTLAAQDLTGEYEVDPAHSRIGFVARHAMVTKVRGQFEKFRGRSPGSPTSPATDTGSPHWLCSVPKGDPRVLAR